MAETEVIYTSLAGPRALYLDLGDGRLVDIVSVSISYALNEIPVATCVIALGRQIAGSGIMLTAHDVLPALPRMSPVSIKMVVPPDSYLAPPDGDKTKPLELFSGYYTGYALNKILGKVVATVHLIGWLADLACSSAVLGFVHPASALDWAFPAVLPTLAPSPSAGIPEAGETLGYLVGHLVAADALNERLLQDVWRALRDLLWGAAERFSTADMLTNLSLAQKLGLINASGKKVASNVAALDALKRMEPFADAEKENAKYVYGKPVKFAEDVQLTHAVGRLAKHISGMALAQLARTTLWDLLTGTLLPSLQLDLCPMSDRAIVMPRLPSYRPTNGQYWRTIRSTDYVMLDMAAVLAKPLRGVVVHGNVVVDHGAANINSRMGALMPPGVPGVFIDNSSSPSARKGSILFVPAPEWLACFANRGASPLPPTANENASTTPPSTTKGEENEQDVKKEEQATAAVLERFAQGIFLQHALYGRRGSLSGRLRFDIAPGSHVRLEVSPEQFAGQDAPDALAASLYGQVERVTIDIDIENRSAATNMLLTHIRTEEENKTDTAAAQAHPLYEASSMVLGAPLLPFFENSR